MEKEEGDECFRRKCKVLLYNMNSKFQISSEFKIGPMRMASHLRWGHTFLCPSFLLSFNSLPDLKQFLNTHTNTHTQK